MIAFGAPSFAGAAMVIPISIHMTKFYADEVLVPLGFLGIAIALARAFDAITDPLMGWISDRTRTRWGRRKPWLALGAPTCAVAFWMLFMPPERLTPTEGALWFTACYLAYYLFHTVYLIPYIALGTELTLDYHQRSTLFGVREGIVIAGTLCAAVLPGLIAESVGSEREALRLFALIFGSLLMLLYLLLLLTLRERPEFVARPPNPLVPGVRRALRSRPFQIILLASVCAGIPGPLAATLVPFFNAYVVQPENPSLWLSAFLFAYFAAAFVSLPLWLRAARRRGKHATLLTAFACMSVATAGTLFTGRGDVAWFLVCLAGAGSAFGAVSFLPLALKADVIDYDELLTGRRREAQFTSFWSIVPKFVQIPAAAIPVAVLASLGYVPNQPQNPEVVSALRLMFGLVPPIFLGLAYWILRRYPITPEVHAAIRRGTEARGRGEGATDPLTGTSLAPSGAQVIDDETTWFLDHFSARELRRFLAVGSRGLVRGVWLQSAGSFALSLPCAALVYVRLDASAKPGVVAVAAVVAMGAAFTAGLFHLMRLSAAQRLAREPAAPGTIQAHLASAAVSSGAVLASPEPALGARSRGGS